MDDDIRDEIADLRVQIEALRRGEGLTLPASGLRLGSMRLHETAAGHLEITGNLEIAGILCLTVYTDATRPSASTVGAGTVICNSDDNGLNVSDGTNWRMPSADGGWVAT